VNVITYSPGLRSTASKIQPVILSDMSVPPILATVYVPASEPSVKSHRSIVPASLHKSGAGSRTIGGQLQSTTVIVITVSTFVHGSSASLVVKVNSKVKPNCPIKSTSAISKPLSVNGRFGEPPV